MRPLRVTAGVRRALVASSLAGCVGNGSTSGDAPTASASATSRVAPAPSTSTKAVAASAPSAPASSASSGAKGDAAPRFACTGDLPLPTPPLAKIPAAVLAQAIIPSLDAAHMKAKLVRGDKGAQVILDCHGGAASTDWEAPEGTKNPTLPGTVRVLGTKALPDQREAVWIATAKDLGVCAAADGYGFLAIVALDGPRLAVLGVSPWHPSCGPTRQIRAEKLGDQTVYVEPDKEGAHAGFSGWENVWTLKDGDLHLAGRYDTLQVGAAESGATVDDAGLYPPSFSATARFVGREIVVSGESTWLKPGSADANGGDPWVFAKKGPYLHRYELRGGVLIETKKEHFGQRQVF